VEESALLQAKATAYQTMTSAGLSDVFALRTVYDLTDEQIAEEIDRATADAEAPSSDSAGVRGPGAAAGAAAGGAAMTRYWFIEGGQPPSGPFMSKDELLDWQMQHAPQLQAPHPWGPCTLDCRLTGYTDAGLIWIEDATDA
jgi:hypothetical protein